MEKRVGALGRAESKNRLFTWKAEKGRGIRKKDLLEAERYLLARKTYTCGYGCPSVQYQKVGQDEPPPENWRTARPKGLR